LTLAGVSSRFAAVPALKLEWDDGPHANLKTEDIAEELERTTLNPGAVAQTIGDADKAMASAVTKVEAI
jgi:isoquinoline 1-oxidoreductase beta subunit